MAASSWTGENVNWTSADTLKLATYHSVLNGLYSALIERLDILQCFQYDIKYLSRVDITLYTPPEAVELIDDIIKYISPFYVNHNDNSGNWHGVASGYLCAPKWANLDEIISHLGYSSRKTVNPLNPQSFREWAFQTYEIINQLRFIRHQATIQSKLIPDPGLCALIQRQVLEASSWEICESLFLSSPSIFPAYLSPIGIRFDSTYDKKTVIPRYRFLTSLPLDIDVEWYGFISLGAEGYYSNQHYPAFNATGKLNNAGKEFKPSGTDQIDIFENVNYWQKSFTNPDIIGNSLYYIAFGDFYYNPVLVVEPRFSYKNW